MTDEKKFDPARSHVLDAPEREQYLPTGVLVEALALTGGERVVDYGAGTGRLALAVADAQNGGELVAVEENETMYEHLAAAVGEHVQPQLVRDNEVPLPDAWANRVLAVNLLHEVHGETALEEMRRLLAPEGQLLVVDWERGGERAFGPPDHLLYSADEAHEELAAAGFTVERLELGLPFHFALRAHPAAQPTPDPSDGS